MTKYRTLHVQIHFTADDLVDGNTDNLQQAIGRQIVFAMNQADCNEGQDVIMPVLLGTSRWNKADNHPEYIGRHYPSVDVSLDDSFEVTSDGAKAQRAVNKAFYDLCNAATAAGGGGIPFTLAAVPDQNTGDYSFHS